MLRAALFSVLLAIVAACPHTTPDPTQPIPRVDDSALRIRVAQAEARRGDGIAELAELARGTKAEKLLALRGLGRIGGPKALPILIAALHEPSDDDVAAAAATSLGLAVSLDEELDESLQIKLTDELATLYRIIKSSANRALVLEAIGRAASSRGTSQLALGAALINISPDIAAAGAFALGRFGRRKIALDDSMRESLVKTTRHADPRVRYAAAYALAREFVLPMPSRDVPTPGTPDEPDARMTAANAALAALLDDADANVRAIAAQGLTRRKAVKDHEPALLRRLHDADWRVAVEAIRGLAGETGTGRGREQAAIAILRWELGIEADARIDYAPAGARESIDPVEHVLVPVMPNKGDERARISRESHVEGWTRTRFAVSAGDAHVVIEGLRTLAPYVKGEAMRAVLSEITAHVRKLPTMDRAWIECLAHAALIRGADVPSYGEIGPDNCKLPEHLLLQLVGELVSAKVGSVGQRREALRQLLGHGDPRVRVAGMTALPTMWADGNDADHRAAVATVIAALGVKDGLVAGNAVDAATAIYEAAGKTAGDWKDALDAAIVARASTERDAELAAALFELIGKQVIASGAPACRAGLAGAPVLAKAAGTCLKALGQPIDPPPIGRAAAPPVRVEDVIGKAVFWHLQTTRGEIVIELSPDIAPWAVATIASLTKRGFYDGLELHRVVPNFVAQGGDPTQSGWGGPGFTLPAEPSSGPGYIAGGVGMADAGRDSAGSQWFIMHSASPHLDGRYTWVGKVVRGQNSADALQIGDRVLRATVEIAVRP